MRLEWDKYFMMLAKLAASRSGCNSRPTGAVVVVGKRVVATGYNGSLPGKQQCTDFGPRYCYRRATGRDDRGTAKYRDCPSIHAEQNAMNQVAANGGLPLVNAQLYCTLFPCGLCMKNLASVGIREVFYEIPYVSDDPERDEAWEKNAEEYGITVKQVSLTEGEAIEVGLLLFEPTSKRRL